MKVGVQYLKTKMGKTKIKGLDIYYNNDMFIVFNSYKINDEQKMLDIINEVKSKMNFCHLTRSDKSLLRQWRAYNRIHRFLNLSIGYTCWFKNTRSPLEYIISFLFGFKKKKRRKK